MINEISAGAPQINSPSGDDFGGSSAPSQPSSASTPPDDDFSSLSTPPGPSYKKLDKTNVEILIEYLSKIENDSEAIDKCISSYHNDYFKISLEKMVMDFISNEKYATAFSGRDIPKILADIPKQTLRDKVKMVAEAYIPEYLRLFAIIMKMKKDDLSVYNKYYKEVLNDLMISWPESTSIEERQPEYRFADMSVNDIKQLFNLDPGRFISNSMKRILCQKNDKSKIVVLNTPINENIGHSNIKNTSEDSNGSHSLILNNSAPWQNFMRSDDISFT